MPGLHHLKLVCGALLLASIGVAAADDASQARQQLMQVQERISSLKARIDRDQRRRGDLSQALSGAEREIAELATRLHESKQAIAEHQRRINDLDARNHRQQQALQDKLEQLGEQIRAAYRTGQQGKLRLLFSQNDAAALGRLLKYHDYYANTQSTAIANVRQDLNALRTTRSELAAQRDALQTQRQSQARLLDGLRDSQREREKALAVVENALQGGGQKLATLKADEKQLQELMEGLRKRLADIPIQNENTAFVQSKGKLTPPVSGRVIASFGALKSGGPLRWQGIWIAAEPGSEITTAAAGRVVYVGQMHRYGLIVVLDHGDDYFTVYGHAQAAFVKVGQWVRVGETIAAAGNSGGHRTSGVYFEIRRGREPVNPAAWLAS